MDNQSEMLVKRRKWKNRLSIAAVSIATVGIAVISIGNYISTRTENPKQMADEFSTSTDFNREIGTVMATGTTSVGVNAVTFEIDFLNDTNLYVEEVYLSNGDSVQAGDRYIKFTDASIADARTELEEAALSAELAYRSGIISDGESKLQAKYEYDAAMLEAQYAQQVYEDTLAQLEADYAQAKKQYEEAQQEYDDYFEKVQNNSFYEEYDIANLKRAYEEAYDLYINRKEYWEITDDELKSGSSSTEGMKMTGLAVLSGSAGEEADGKEQEAQKTKTEDAAEVESETETDTKDEQETEQRPSAPDGAEKPKGFGDMGQQEEQNAKKDREWIVKTISLLEQEMEDAKNAYATALEEYESDISSAELKLQKLLNQLETAREDYMDADVSYQKQTLNAKTVYELSVAKGQTAQNDYQTQLTGLADNLGRLQDAKEEAGDNLALFEELVGDGYLYTEEGGTVLMLMAQEGQSLTGGSMIFAYSNPEQLSVSVSVSQNDIAKLSVGEKATVVLEEHGSYSGIIETINPVSASNSRTSVTYTVTVNLQGDVSGLDANLTANVIFGEEVPQNQPDSFKRDVSQDMGGQQFGEKEGEHGRSGKTDQKAHDREN